MFFLLYINDLADITAKNAKVVLYADDTSLIINSPSPTQFTEKLHTAFTDVTEWFKNNLLSLNFSKTTYIQFRTKNSQTMDLKHTLLKNQITDTTSTKFLGLTIDETSWKGHIHQVVQGLAQPAMQSG